MYDQQALTADAFLAALKARMRASETYAHRFLVEFRERTLSRSQLERFAVQWYKTARAHKIAFPALIFNVRDDDVRFELVEILFDEYGMGDRSRIHARLLLRFLGALGIAEADVDGEVTIPAVEQFSDEVLRVWRDEEPVLAFGLHFALEYLAASLHAHFSEGLAKYPFLSADAREYFDYHKVAEQNHTDYSETGILVYGSTPEHQRRLEEGVDRGILLLENLWNGFHGHVFGDDGGRDVRSEQEMRYSVHASEISGP